jgi:hypothetical protein
VQLLRIVDVNVKAGSHMKTKSIAILQSFVMVVGLIVAPAYGDGEHAGGGEGATAAQTRPGVTPPASADSYLALERITKAEEIKAKSDARGDEEFTLKKEDLNGKFSKWIIAIENMHAKDVVCKDVRGAKQVDDLLRKYVGNLSDELNQASKTNDDADRRIDVKNLYAITEALRTVLAAQLEAAGAKKIRVEAQNKALLELLEKTNVFVAGVENQAKLDEKFKAELPALLASKINDSIKAGEESLKLEEIVAKAKESVAKGDGEACVFLEPAKTGRGGKKKKGDDAAVKELEAKMAEAAEEQKKKDAEHKAALEAKDLELKKIVADAQKRTEEKKWPATPATDSKPGDDKKPGAGGVDEKGGKGGAGGGAGSDSGGGAGASTQNIDPAYPDLNAALGTGINGQLGDLAALEDQYRRQHELDNLELQKALLAQQQPLATPSFSSKSATPAAPPPPAIPPSIPPVAVGATNPPPPYPPMQPMPPMGGMPPYGMIPPPPPPPVAPVPVKTETTTETEERYTPPTSMVQPIQLPMPMPQQQMGMYPPTVVNDVNIIIRYPNGTTATWPANQPIPAGATQVTSSNPYATGTGNVTTANPTAAANTSTITGMVSSVNTSNRTGSTTQSTNSSNVNTANPNGQRGGLTW